MLDERFAAAARQQDHTAGTSLLFSASSGPRPGAREDAGDHERLDRLDAARLHPIVYPRLREQTEQFASHPRWDAIGGTVAQTVVSGTTIVEGYAGDNTYLFWFLIAACVFVVLMLKVIS